jgi:DHA1 family inner membrane transport protein
MLSLPLLALAVASFGIGTSEFVIMGLLPDVARDLRVGVPQAGMLISLYALGVMVGAPLMTLALARLPRRQALLGLLGLFVVGNAACAMAPTYGVLLAARLLTSLTHGTFFGIGAIVAAGLVERRHRSRAVALMFSGLTLANVLGVPGGTALGQAFGWRATFWAIVPIGLFAAAAVACWLPRLPPPPAIRLRRELSVLGQRQVMLAMAISALASASLFSALTFVTPMLEQVTGMAPHTVAWVLVLFGVGITFGNLVGGRLADWRQLPALIGILACLALVTIGVGLSLRAAVPATIAMIVWGAVQFACGAPLQTRVVDQAREAPNLASALNQSAFNAGNAGGAWIGAAALTAGMPYADLPYVASSLAAAGLLLALIAAMLERPARAAVA